MPFIISAHQPNFLPYLGFVHKMWEADAFIIMDDVYFSKSNWYHRNRIRIAPDKSGASKFKWLTLPVEHERCLLRHVRLRLHTRVKGTYWHRSIIANIEQFYRKALYFDQYYPRLHSLLDNPDERMLDYNMRFIKDIKNLFHLHTRLFSSSELSQRYAISVDGARHRASLQLACLCKAVRQEMSLKSDIEYLSGIGGNGYLIMEPFVTRGIKVRFQHFSHPVYPQQHKGAFLPCMSYIDLVFNVGPFPVERWAQLDWR